MLAEIVDGLAVDFYGTDGARLCYMGLPCPNLGTGGSNYHGTHEYADADEMRMCVEILKEIVRAR